MRWLLLACVLTVIAASGVTAYSIARADSTATVTITAMGWAGQCTGPSDLVATRLSNDNISLTWTPGLGNVTPTTLIRRAIGSSPASATDTTATEVYNGNGTSATDYVDLTNINTTVVWRAYTWCPLSGNYTSAYSEARLTGGITMMYIGIFGLCLGMSWLAFRGRFILWSIAASISWVALWMYIESNPPGGVTAGDPLHTVLMLLPIAAAVAVMLHSLGREITTQKDMRTGLDVSRSFEQWKFGGQAEEEQETSGRRSSEEELDEYRMKVRGALRNRRYEGRRR